MWCSYKFFCLSLDAESTQQENVPPSTPSGPQESNPRCTLSNPSLMSSAPNILQPLTLNSSNGLLETIFPVEHTPSPESPNAAAGQDNADGGTGHCRRRLALQSRPFSELYSEELVPLDSDITSPEIVQNSHIANNENALSGNETTDENNLGDSRTSTSLANSTDTETTGQGLDFNNALEDTGGATLTSPQSCESNQDLESQPMDVTEETDNVNDSTLSVEMPVINGEVEMTLPCAGQRNSIGSIGSIELTEDSPLRILEECERVREEEIALSSENLLQDPTAESDDELEQMDVSDETMIPGPDSSLNSDNTMDDVLTMNAATGTEESALNQNVSIETQPVTDHETELFDSASNSLLEEGESDPILSSVHECEGSQASPPVVDCLPGPSVAAALIETDTQSEEVIASEGSVELQSFDSQLITGSSGQQELNQEDVPMSLLEYVDHIVGDESNDNAMIVESVEVEGNSQEGASSSTSGLRTSVDSESAVAISSLTLPVASEPVCLDATSLQSTSTSEMLVDTPVAAVVVDDRTAGGHATPNRPPQSKCLSRSSSDPRSTHSRRERSRNAARDANQAENSPRLSRPPLVRRVTEPTTGQTTCTNSETLTVNTAPVSTSQEMEPANTMAVSIAVAHSTSVTGSVSPTESVVMAVPLSPPPQCNTLSGVMSTVVVADGVAEPEATVTPLPSPEFSSEVPGTAFDTQSTDIAVPVERDRSDSPTTRDLPNDYVLIIPAENRQPSSAPSTLQRDAIPANATVLTNRTQAPRRRSTSQDTPSSIIYATPVSGLNGELAESYNVSASFPRQSSAARVTALSGNRRRSSSSGAGSSIQTRTASGESQSLPRDSSRAVSVASRIASQDSEQSRSNTTERVNNDSSLGATSLPGPSTSTNSDLNQSREAIQNLLRSYCVKTSQVPKGPSVGQPTASSAPVQAPEAGRRAPETNNQSVNRRSSGRRQQGQPVHLSIQDQQQTREQQARPEQPPAEEEPLPSSKNCDGHHTFIYFIVTIEYSIFII